MTHETENTTFWRALEKNSTKRNTPSRSGIGATGLFTPLTTRESAPIWKASVLLTMWIPAGLLSEWNPTKFYTMH